MTTLMNGNRRNLTKTTRETRREILKYMQAYPQKNPDEVLDAITALGLRATNGQRISRWTVSTLFSKTYGTRKLGQAQQTLMPTSQGNSEAAVKAVMELTTIGWEQKKTIIRELLK